MAPEEIKTINDMFALLGRFILWAGGIAGAITGIWALITKIRSRGAIAKLNERVAKDEKRLDDQEGRITGLEENLALSKDDLKDMHELSKLTLSAVQQLLKSNLQEGNNHEGMQKASNAIDEYLNNLI